jgi:hypothetical protein
MTGNGVPLPCQYCTSDVRYSRCTSVKEALVCDNRTLDCKASGAGHRFGPNGPNKEAQCEYCGMPELIDPAFPAAVFEHDLFPPPASEVPVMGTRVNEMQHLLSKIRCSCRAGLPLLELKEHSDECAQVLASRVSELLRGMA